MSETGHFACGLWVSLCSAWGQCLQISNLELLRWSLRFLKGVSCNVFADTCPSKFDGKCDSQIDECEGGDCYDCDQCQQFHYDCNACISNGCYYCPGDALCFNSPYYIINAFSHCAESNDYTQETCSEPGNFFRYVRI